MRHAHPLPQAVLTLLLCFRKFRHDRRMVARALPTARLLVYPRTFATFGQRLRAPDVVNAQTEVATEPSLPVVPPRELPAARIVQTERIRKAPRLHLFDGCTLGLAEEDAPAPKLRVVHVAVFGRDVEVTTEQHVVVGPELFVQMRAQTREPFELELILVRPDRLPVWHIDVDDVDAPRPRRDDARMRALLVARHAAAHIFKGVARKYRHAVVGRLAVDSREVTGRLKLRRRKALVHALQLLQTENVRPRLFQPTQDERQQRQHRIYVPCC